MLVKWQCHRCRKVVFAEKSEKMYCVHCGSLHDKEVIFSPDGIAIHNGLLDDRLVLHYVCGGCGTINTGTVTGLDHCDCCKKKRTNEELYYNERENLRTIYSGDRIMVEWICSGCGSFHKDIYSENLTCDCCDKKHTDEKLKVSNKLVRFVEDIDPLEKLKYYLDNGKMLYKYELLNDK